MATKEIKGVRIKFKRDLETNYDNSFVPLYGEICLVETTDGRLRAKVGDGVTQFSSIPYMDKELVTQELFNEIVLTIDENDPECLVLKKPTLN